MTDHRHWAQNQDRLLQLITFPRFGIISDYDGTLSPFVAQPQDAVITPGNARALDHLAGQVTVVALVSGRSVADLRQRFERPWAVYYGSHGMEFWRDGRVQIAPQAQPFVEPLRALLAVVRLREHPRRAGREQRRHGIHPLPDGAG